MARISVSFAESAVLDLEAILARYAGEFVPEIGRRLVTEIFEHAETLADNPDIGRVVPEFDQAHLRELVHPPFRIVYKREKSRVRIVRVWRSERLLVIPT